MDSFWKSIVNDIEKKINSEPLQNWNQERIEYFLEYEMYDNLEREIKMDKRKADLCGIPLKPLSPTSFRRIFMYKNSGGNKTTRNQFAIYLGYNSFSHYIKEKKIPLKQQKQENRWVNVKYVEASSLESLEKKVAKYMKKGWELHCSLVVNNPVIGATNYYQAMKSKKGIIE